MLKRTLLLILLLCCSPAFAVAAQPALAVAEKLIGQGKNDAAIASLQQVVRSAPEHYQAWFLLGVTEAKLRRFHDAIASFRQVISLQPTLAEPHNNLAVIYNELGDYKAAIEELEASLKLKPGYATAQENIGDLYLKLAADAYRKALLKGDNEALRRRYERLLRIRIKEDAPVEAIAQGAAETAAPVQVKQPATQPEQAQSSVAVDNVAETAQADTADQAADSSSEAESGSKKAAAPLAEADISSALAAVEAWRSAWAAQKMNAYFAAYAEEFDTGNRFDSLEKWKNYKRWAIGKRKFIQVTLENIETTIMEGDVIRVVFLQHFRSDSFNSDDIKELLLRKKADGWKIIHEVSK